MNDPNALAGTISQAATDALHQAEANPTTEGITAAVENLADTVVIAAATEANPLAGAAASLLIKPIIHQLAVAIVQLCVHIGAEIPAGINKLIEDLEAGVHIDLNGDGVIGVPPKSP